MSFHCFAGEQLQINQPHVYDCHVPQALASSVPSMVHLCGGGVNVSDTDASSTAANRSVTLTSLGGSEFLSFAKGASFNNGGGPSYHLLFKYLIVALDGQLKSVYCKSNSEKKSVR